MENVRAFFEKEKACKSTINRMAVVKRTAEATGLSERTLRDIHKEHVARDGQLLTPVKRYTTSRIRINPDTFDREAIRRLVHAFYIRREYPTIAAVLEKAKEECGFPGGRFCLWRVLKEMGFTYKKRDNKKYIYEQTNILEQRHTFMHITHTSHRVYNSDRVSKSVFYVGIRSCVLYQFIEPVYVARLYFCTHLRNDG